MHLSGPTWWRVGKLLLTLLILLCVAVQFARILLTPELWQAHLQLRGSWAVGAGILYLLGLGCSALFWYYLQRLLGERPRCLGILRAYYLGQMGRYVPGKVVGIVLRSQLLSGPGSSRRVAVLTIIYESLTTMTAGALLAVLLLPARAVGQTGGRWHALGFLLLLGIPLLPSVFNRLVRKFTPPLAGAPDAPPPRLGISTLTMGLLLTGGGWVLQGASLWAMLQALLPQAQPWSWQSLADCTGIIALATVLGFLVIAVPGGLGVRELIVQQYLAVDLVSVLGEEQALLTSVVTALLLRLVWTLAEVSTAGILYWVPAQPSVSTPQTVAGPH